MLLTTLSKKPKDSAKNTNSLAELKILGEELSEEPTLGIPLGNDVYKIRLAISSKGKDKSGGGRVISYVKIDNETVLLTIYNKGEKDTISDKEIQQLIKNL